MEQLTVNKLYKLSGTEQIFTDWINDMKFNYAQSGSTVLFEDWLANNYMNFADDEKEVVAETVVEAPKVTAPVVKETSPVIRIIFTIGVLLALYALVSYGSKAAIKVKS